MQTPATPELSIEAAKAYVASKLTEWGQEAAITAARWQNVLLGEVVEVETSDGLRWDVWVEGDTLYGEC